MISFRESELDKINIEVITEYLAIKRPEIGDNIKISQVIRYALSIAAINIRQEINTEQAPD